MMTKEADEAHEETITDPEEKFGFEVTRDYTSITEKYLKDLLSKTGFKLLDLEKENTGITGKETSRLIKFAAQKINQCPEASTPNPVTHSYNTYTHHMVIHMERNMHAHHHH
jgi:hypothetical protein